MESPETNIDARRTAPVESLTSEDGLREAKALDDLAFGEHQGISLETHGILFRQNNSTGCTAYEFRAVLFTGDKGDVVRARGFQGRNTIDPQPRVSAQFCVAMICQFSQGCAHGSSSWFTEFP